ncbi:MAG: phosphatase PAP2 family protein [Desulfobacterales bacterium]
MGKKEPVVLVAVLIIAGSLWGFAKLSDEVIEGDTHAVDRRLIIAMRNPQDLTDPLGPRWLEEMGRDFTAMGGLGVLTFLTLASAGFLVLQNKTRSAAFLLTAVGSGLILSFLLKSGFDRPRPDLVPHGSFVYTASFPSGHAMMSAVTYLTLGMLLARHQPRRRLKAYLILLAVTLTLAVGVSRVYLGVHWPTDVLAGWTLGASWALLCWLIALWLQRRGQMDEEG